MKYLLLIPILTIWVSGTSQTTGEIDQRTAVENILRDYIEGWYNGDTVRMARSLHDDLVKRIPVKNTNDSSLSLRMVPKLRMVALTGEGGGESPDGEYQIFIDDIEKDIASARVLSLEYLDYVHLARTNEGWKIVNILFCTR